MSIIDIMSFMAVTTLLVISPGPNGVLIAKTVSLSGGLSGKASGKTAGFANIAGFVVAFYLHGSLSILGISVLLVKSADAFLVFKMVGAAYLCWVGVKSLWSALKTQQTIAGVPNTVSKGRYSNKKAFLEGFLTNALNPKVSMFYLAAFPQFIPSGAEISTAYFLVFLHAVIAVMWFSAMVLLLSRFTLLATKSSVSRWLKSITGIVFIGFGAKLASLENS
jgi:threonine/homoserine/homoserine lactone efflux protein